MGVVTLIVFEKRSTVRIDYVAGRAVKLSWPLGERKGL
jgi:hypothetical protein